VPTAAAEPAPTRPRTIVNETITGTGTEIETGTEIVIVTTGTMVTGTGTVPIGTGITTETGIATQIVGVPVGRAMIHHPPGAGEQTPHTQ
jgi:hypothetical protein